MNWDIIIVGVCAFISGYAVKWLRVKEYLEEVDRDLLTLKMGVYEKVKYWQKAHEEAMNEIERIRKQVNGEK